MNNLPPLSRWAIFVFIVDVLTLTLFSMIVFAQVNHGWGWGLLGAVVGLIITANVVATSYLQGLRKGYDLGLLSRK